MRGFKVIEGSLQSQPSLVAGSKKKKTVPIRSMIIYVK